MEQKGLKPESFFTLHHGESRIIGSQEWDVFNWFTPWAYVMCQSAECLLKTDFSGLSLICTCVCCLSQLNIRNSNVAQYCLHAVCLAHHRHGGQCCVQELTPLWKNVWVCVCDSFRPKSGHFMRNKLLGFNDSITSYYHVPRVGAVR